MLNSKFRRDKEVSFGRNGAMQLNPLSDVHAVLAIRRGTSYPDSVLASITELLRTSLTRCFCFHVGAYCSCCCGKREFDDSSGELGLSSGRCGARYRRPKPGKRLCGEFRGCLLAQHPLWLNAAFELGVRSSSILAVPSDTAWPRFGKLDVDVDGCFRSIIGPCHS